MMYHRYLIVLALLFSTNVLLAQEKKAPKTFDELTTDLQKQTGYFDFYWDEKQGKIWVEIDKLDTEFLYVNSLPAGIGSNDIGLDRGQLGRERIVKFTRSGNKILLTHLNYKYRAVSDNSDERQSVEEAFAQSVLWGFKVTSEKDGRILVDATKFLLRDAHDVAGSLKKGKQGQYKLDESRSAIYLKRTKNFPKNTEFESTLTFTGNAEGSYIRTVTPSPEAVTVRQHHSFVELPDAGYQPRVFDPRCGYFEISYQDYATPVTQPLVKRLITRHRLEKKNPNAKMSEPVEPIIYYLDRGAPEPIKSALMEGATWWNQAFEAAGYKNAFQVRELPADADPMDVRYNLIQWVHRSTRGWSYGSSVIDPRTGEIIKGHVSLGSLRVRQDFLIAQGLSSGYAADGVTPDPQLLEMALARLRQLSAHEVGHTIGLAHNFAASGNDRASVMDYPHPYVTVGENGQPNFENAYDDKIGAWDKRTVIYGYQDFPKGTNEGEALQQILTKNAEMGLQYISDQDARSPGSAHPAAHLWDNGNSPTEELKRMIKVRKKSLKNLNLNSLPEGMPVAHLENILVPIYLSPRYQVEAVAKLIGGVNYEYSVNSKSLKNQKTPLVSPVDAAIQKEALNALLETLTADYLKMPNHLLDLIPPQPIGYSRDRELFKTNTSMIFDPLAAAETSANNTLKFILNPERLARVVEQNARNSAAFISLNELLENLNTIDKNRGETTPFDNEMIVLVEKLTMQHLFQLASHNKGNQQVAAAALFQINKLEKVLISKNNGMSNAHETYLTFQIEQFKKHPENYKMPATPAMPTGSPIGCGHSH
ncbi:MAG: hypothetical protein ACI9XO_000815 [Paraglaciecola sp.]|jgi:hypothetical protein